MADTKTSTAENSVFEQKPEEADSVTNQRLQIAAMTLRQSSSRKMTPAEELSLAQLLVAAGDPTQTRQLGNIDVPDLRYELSRNPKRSNLLTDISGYFHNSGDLGPRLALAFAENEFDNIHEPGSGAPGQITFRDLLDYSKTHTGNPISTLMVNYLLDNNDGHSEPNVARFNVIRSMDTRDGGDEYFGTTLSASNASGITKSDLQTGRATIPARLKEANAIGSPAEPFIHLSNAEGIHMTDLKQLETIWPLVAKGNPTIDKSSLTRYADCACNGDEGGRLETLANGLSFISDYAGSGGKTLSWNQLRAAEAKLQKELDGYSADLQAFRLRRDQVLQDIKPLLTHDGGN